MDTRKSAKSAGTGLYPVAIRLYHHKTRMIPLLYYTSTSGWDERSMKLKKTMVNKHIDCDKANESINDKLHLARKLIVDLGESIEGLDPDMLVEYIRKAWDKKVATKIREEIHNGMTLSEWGN